MKIFQKESVKMLRSDPQREVSIGNSIARLKKHNLSIGSFVSIGAGSGSDSVYLHNALCPSAPMLMIEAQDSHRPQLEKIRSANPKQDYIICAAAEQDGEVSFLASAPTGGAVSQHGQSSIVVQARSIDSLVHERSMPGPYFLKFDTHGVELEILSGAVDVLKNTQLIMMECYNFKLNFVDGKNLTFYEMCSFMLTKGFRCVDISDPLFRPNDLVLWQMHLYFIPADHPVFNSNSYNAPSPFLV